VPIFIEEESNDFESLLKKSSAFGMGGWWLGGAHMKPNTDFLRQVQQKVPKDAKVRSRILLRNHERAVYVRTLKMGT